MFDDIIEDPNLERIKMLCKKNGITERELVDTLPHPMVVKHLSGEKIYLFLEMVLYHIVERRCLQNSINVV